MQSEQKEVRIGLLAAVGAHLMWGVFPLFWRQLGEIDALQVVAHRVLWAFVFLLISLPLLLRFLDSGSRRQVAEFAKSRRIWGVYALAAVLIAVNWLTFIWAVNHDRVVESSLGYYINPLLNVLLGVWVLGERLTRSQWVAIGCAAIGVAIMTIAGGGLPWVSLVLATSFAVYGLVKKKAPLPALIGLFFETSVLLLPALVFLAYVDVWQGNGVWHVGHPRLIFMLLLGGTITIAPLALFAFAARRAPLSAIGVLQYIGPTMQFLLGVFLFNEAFGKWQLAGFACVWLAVAIYLWSGTQGERSKVQKAGTQEKNP